MEATASAPVSSGRHRRGSVKEIDAAPQGSSSSGRHRRGSVREIDPGKATHAGNLGFHKLRSSSGAQPSSPTPAAARRHRRLSVGDAPVEMPASKLPPGKVVTGLEGLISGQADMGSMGVSRRQNRGLERSPSSKNLGGGVVQPRFSVIQERKRLSKRQRESHSHERAERIADGCCRSPSF